MQHMQRASASTSKTVTDFAKFAFFVFKLAIEFFELRLEPGDLVTVILYPSKSLGTSVGVLRDVLARNMRSNGGITHVCHGFPKFLGLRVNMLPFFLYLHVFTIENSQFLGDLFRRFFEFLSARWL
jgi:hypothetical protein